MANTIDIVIPDLGDFEDVEIIEVLVAAGDSVERESGLITLETDKASMDIPAPADGVIEELTVAVGDKVSSGDVIGKLATADEGSADEGSADEGTADEGTADEGTADDADSDNQTEAAGTGQQAEATPDKAPAAKEAPAGKQTLSVPDLGDFSDVEIIEVHIAEGDQVEVDDPLVTLETDKAAMDVPAVAGGKILSVSVKVGDKVSKGDALAEIEASAVADDKDDKDGQDDQEAAGQTATTKSPTALTETDAREQPVRQQAVTPEAPRALPTINEAGFARAHASPSVRKLARELGVNLEQVKGSGKKERVLHDDVKAFVKAILTGQAAGSPGTALPQTPVVDFAKFGEIETRPLTRIQKISGPRLQASWINLPHVTQHDNADITDLEAKRQQLKGAAKERGISLTPLAFIMKAVVAALQEFPMVNSSLSEDGKSLIYKKYIHLGFAADTDQGLMVPVIRDADKKDVYEIAGELGELSALARDGKLKADQLQGGTFTISSLGGIGGTLFTPIVNAPEVAILGVCRSTLQPVWDGAKFEPRLMLPLSFSYDHRVIDGAQAVRFTTFLGQKLADVDTLLQAIP